MVDHPMKQLFIMRHAKSSWKEIDLIDHDRPLNKRGNRDAPRMGKLLVQQGLLPELILSSTALRARSTAMLVADALDYEDAIELNENLYHPTVANCIEVLESLYYNYDSVLLVAHNPGVERLTAHLTGKNQEFPTATIAHIKLPINSWRDLTMRTEGKLKNIWRPKEIEAR